MKEKVTKKIIVGTMQNYTGVCTGKRWNRDDASAGYEAFIASVKGLLLTYGKVVINGFGTFEVKFRKGYKVKNNFEDNGSEYYDVGERQYVVFTPSDVFSDAVKNLNYKFEDGGEED